MNAAVSPEVLLRRTDDRQTPRELATPGIQRWVWESRYGTMLIEVTGDEIFVNGQRVQPHAAQPQTAPAPAEGFSAHPHNRSMTTINDRVLPLAGATNFRDLGGYAGLDGRPLRWRLLFRSDHLGGLTPSDHSTLSRLGIQRAFDFRGQQERAAQPYEIPGLKQHSLAIEPSVTQQMDKLASSGMTLTPERMATLMEDLYRRLVNVESERFAVWFAHLLEDNSPLVFHCTAGKDRTGVAAALLLRALGVPQAVVEDDFLLTNRHFRSPRMADHRLDPEVLQVLWSVRLSFLQAATQAIDEQHGGLDRYLEERMRLTPAARARLAEHYLQPA